MSGADAQWNNSEYLYVGSRGTGTLEISDGGVVSSWRGIVGDFAKGTATVSGVGSQWNVTDYIGVGNTIEDNKKGDGLLEILNGGTVSSATLFVGNIEGTKGKMLVSGSGSRWDGSGVISVGLYGEGDLEINDHGVVSNGKGQIAVFEGSVGTVTVDGAGSQWINSGVLQIGEAGAGTLTISDSGLVRATNGTAIAKNTTATGRLDVKTGGVLETLALAAGQGTVSSASFDDGILRAIGDNAAFITGFAAGEFTIGAGGLVVDDSGFAIATDESALGGAGGLTKIGNGTFTLNGLNTYAGATAVAAGTLKAGIENAFSAASSFSVESAAILDANGLNQTIASLANNGTVVVGSTDSAGAVGAVLTTTGNYVGNGGTLALRTVLGDDASDTDKLLVQGGTSGNSFVKVENVGGTGDQTVEGIRIIEVAGASAGTFTLLGDYVTQDGQQAVVGGAYAYTLEKDGINAPDGNWYLRSRLPTENGGGDSGPRYAASVPVHEAYPQALLGLNGLPTWQQRVGNRYLSASDNGVWVRIEGIHNQIESRRSTTDMDYDQDVFRLQAGVDAMLSNDGDGKLTAGAFLHYVNGLAKIDSIYNAQGRGRIRSEGYGVGGTLTWLGKSGAYVDSQIQATVYNSDLTGGQRLVKGNDGFGYALSVESGKRVALGSGSDWSLTPQAQLVYSRVSFDGFRDSYGAAVSLNQGASLQGRLGLELGRDIGTKNAKSPQDGARIYGIGNLYYEFLNGTRVDVADTRIMNRSDRLRGGIGIGGSHQWADGKYAIYGEGLATTSLSNFGDSNSIQGNIGFRVRW